MKKFKQHNWSIIQQAIFFPAYAKALAGRFTYRSFSTGRLLTLSFFLITACPDPPETTDCGSHQIEINGACVCEEGYHWNEDETKCLMDTTSHNFVWEIDTLGEGGSYLNDVAIIDENNVWVVGEFETDSGKYGGAYWNGVSWELKKLIGPGISVQTITPRGLWYFSEDNIWFASGSIYHWDGIETSLVWLRDLNTDETVEKIWASSLENIYFIGNEGTIIHYNGSTFTRMESGTNIRLTDIFGIDNEHIWAVGDDDGLGIGESVVLFFDGSNWETKFYYLYNQPAADFPGGVYRTVWAYDDTLYISGGQGIWKESIESGNGFLESYIGTIYPAGVPKKMKGIGYNDFFNVGVCQALFHYNGKTWFRYLPHDCSTFVAFYSVDYVQPGFVVAVGFQYVFRGIRIWN